MDDKIILEPKLMDLTFLCQSFPKLPKPLILRENILDTIERMFIGDIEMVVLEGGEGLGKTILLAQFMQRHPMNTFSAFIKPASKLGYDPSSIRYDLCCQLLWLLYPNKECEPDEVDEGYLHNLLLKIRKLARNTTYYFVLDGLAEINDKNIFNDILDILPFDQGFHFLLSGDLDIIPDKLCERISCKSCQIVNFSLDETLKYFHDLNINHSIIEELYQTCGRGIPGHLASVRRNIISGIDPQSLIKGKLTDWFEAEWKQVSNELMIQITSLVAFAQHRLSTEEIAHLLKKDNNQIKQIISGLSFLSIDENTFEVSFVSEAFNKFASNKLRDLRENVIDLIINDLVSKPESENSIDHLPEYFELRGKLKEILECLSPEYFEKIVEHSQSLVSVKKKADIGISTALKLFKDGDLMRFSMQKSVISELEWAGLCRSEIKALMSLKNYNEARNLAQSMVLKEDRLQLLSVIAKFYREEGFDLETDLIEEIRLLYEQIDLKNLGDRALDIASDLFYSCPDLAINLVEKATSTETGENSLDMVYTKLSVSALMNRGRSKDPLDTIETIRTRIKDPKLRSFTAVISLAVGNQTSQEIINEVKKLEMIEYRLNLLRQWILENKREPTVSEVIEYALDLTIRTTEYAPNARVFRELASPLPFLLDKMKMKHLIGIFDSQRKTIENIGPTEDYVRLQLLLAQTEKIYDKEGCRNRLIEIYFFICELEDINLKTSCLAWFLSALTKIDCDNEFEVKDQIKTITTEDFNLNLEILLNNTANHYINTKSIIKAFAISNANIGFKLSLDLNTQERRDDAILDLVEAMLKNDLEKIDFDLLNKCLNSFFDKKLRDESLIKIIDRFSSEKICSMSLLHKLLSFINKISEIKDSIQRCCAYCLAHSCLKRLDTVCEYESMRAHLLSSLNASWQCMDVIWAKIDTGLRIVHSLAEDIPELAQKYFKEIDLLRENMVFNTPSTASLYQTCLRLIVRAFSGILLRNFDTNDDFTRLSDLINYLPSNGEKSEVWAELALRCFIARRSDLGRDIVSNHVKPLLYSIPDSDCSYKNNTIVSIIPALYMAHATTAKELIQTLPLDKQDRALARVIEFLLRRQPLSDPYESHDQGYNVDYDTIIEIIDLIQEIKMDYFVYHFIECIADTVNNTNRFRIKFTPQHRAEITNRLEKIVQTKFPDLNNIHHEGYKIAAEAQIARIRQSKTQVWEELLVKARNIPNISDRSIVLAMIGRAMPSRESEKRKKTFIEAITVAKKIPSILDQIERLVDLSSIIINITSDLAIECLKLAMKLIVNREAYGSSSIQKRIVDLAYKIDSELAASLASLADDDPARKYARSELKQRLKVLKLKKSIINISTIDENLPVNYRTEFPEASWLALGSLNSGKTSHIHIEHTRPSILCASNYPLNTAYPILSYIIENAVKRHSNTDQAKTTLRQLLDATFLTAEISIRMTTHFFEKIQKTKLRIIKESEHGIFLIQAGHRERGLQVLRDWLGQEETDYLKICDQFFGPSDLEVLMLIKSVKPNCKVHILTSKKHHDHEGILKPDIEYLQYWRNISDQDPPHTEVVIIGIESSGKSPIHDRWWLTKSAGLKIGNSYNSLGITQDTSINYISESDAKFLESDVDQYLINKKREYNNEKLRYLSFIL